MCDMCVCVLTLFATCQLGDIGGCWGVGRMMLYHYILQVSVTMVFLSRSAMSQGQKNDEQVDVPNWPDWSKLSPDDGNISSQDLKTSGTDKRRKPSERNNVDKWGPELMDRRSKALTGATNPVVKECRTCRMIPLTHHPYCLNTALSTWGWPLERRIHFKQFALFVFVCKSFRRAMGI